MFDHIGIGVSNLKQSRDFFVKALAPVGMEVLAEYPDTVGLGRKPDACLWLGVAKGDTMPIHVAFTAQERSQVDEFYRLAIAAGAKDNGPPGLRPDYSPTYYAAFVIGPDGHNVEVVCHKAEG